MTAQQTDSKRAWRLLTRADAVQKGDQALSDDCETWHDLPPLWWGMPYNPGLFLPARRRVEANPIPSQDTPK